MKKLAVFMILSVLLMSGCSAIPVVNTGTGREYLNDTGTRTILLYPQSGTFMLRQFESTFEKSGVFGRKTHHYLIRYFYGNYSIIKKTIRFSVKYSETFKKYSGLNPDDLRDSRRTENLENKPIVISLKLKKFDLKYLKLENVPATENLPKGFPGETSFRYISEVTVSYTHLRAHET